MVLGAVVQGEPGLGQRPRDVTGQGSQRVVVPQRPTVRIGQQAGRGYELFALGESP
jgi:hypothetical protein